MTSTTPSPALQRAWKRACGKYKAAGFRNAYYHGAVAATKGKSLDACPYRPDDKKTWRRVYRKAWQDGWRSMKP